RAAADQHPSAVVVPDDGDVHRGGAVVRDVVVAPDVLGDRFALLDADDLPIHVVDRGVPGRGKRIAAVAGAAGAGGDVEQLGRAEGLEGAGGGQGGGSGVGHEQEQAAGPEAEAVR